MKGRICILFVCIVLIVIFQHGIDAAELQEAALDLRFNIGNRRVQRTVGGNACNTTVDIVPEIINGRTYVPTAFIEDNFGVKAVWLESSQEVLLDTSFSYDLRFRVGEADVYKGESIEVVEAPIYLKNNRAMLPIRFVAESMGYEVFWLAESQQITITGKVIVDIADRIIAPRMPYQGIDFVTGDAPDEFSFIITLDEYYEDQMKESRGYLIKKINKGDANEILSWVHEKRLDDIALNKTMTLMCGQQVGVYAVKGSDKVYLKFWKN